MKQKNCELCDRVFTVKGRRCPSCVCKIRRVKHKHAAILHLGGICAWCGLSYNIQNLAAFEFHHLDPTNKDFQIGKASNKSWDVLRIELDKCLLVCSNCHSIYHAKKEDNILSAALGEQYLASLA